MTLRLLVGDCRAMLATLPDASVHACITSPPYYGLRAYGTNPQVWGGDPACAHEWGDEGRSGQRLRNGQGSDTAKVGFAPVLHPSTGAYCTRCASWRGELGSEPTPEQFVANLVAVFREVRRVLHPTGVLVLNLGDSYAGSGKGPTGHNGFQNAETRQGFTAGYVMQNGQVSRGGRKSKTDAPAGYKAKDLMQMPARVAMALQADGWYLRSAMPWLKRAAMPESVTDRPSNALEWLFLFSKAPRYFWDAEAIRQGASPVTIERHAGRPSSGVGPRAVGTIPPGHPTATHPEQHHSGSALGNGAARGDVSGRAFRNTDPWFLSLDAAIADARAALARLEAMRATGGVLCDDNGLPLAVDINPAAFAQAHFATYPPALVVPFVKAGTSERGCCPRCLAPWRRVVERSRGPLPERINPKDAARMDMGLVSRVTGLHQPGWQALPEARMDTLGWAASCACEAGEPVKTTVLDCFAGSGTTLLVADRLGRDAVGIELSPEYARMAEARIAGDAPLWVDMAAVETAAGDYAPLSLFEEAAG